MGLKKVMMFQSCVAQMSLDPMGIHGPIHWFKVYRNCQDLHVMEHGATPSEGDEWFYWCFSMLHDCCRKSDFTDPAHGIEAAKMVPTDDSEFNNDLKDAIGMHTAGKLVEKPRIAICWDADRLELPRVNVVPHPKFMSTKAGKAAAEAYHTPPAGYDPETDDPRR